MFHGAMHRGVLLLLACCLALPACSSPPDKDEAARRVMAVIRLGWSCLRADAARIAERLPAGKNWKLRVALDLRLDCDVAALPDEERERLARYLGACGENFRRRGDACRMEEDVVFTKTAYGWMPRELALSDPAALPCVAAESRGP